LKLQQGRNNDVETALTVARNNKIEK